MPSNGHQLAELSSQYFYKMKIELDYFNKYPKGNYLITIIVVFFILSCKFLAIWPLIRNKYII